VLNYDVNDWGAAVDIKILKNQAGNGGAYEIKIFEEPSSPIVKSEEGLNPVCIAKNKAVPPPRFWPIANAKDNEGIKPMRLLVFHLLPMGAASTRAKLDNFLLS